MHRDYAPQGVQFIYVYKALAHPELNGYVQPFTLEERLMHVKEAERTLGSQFTWICDDMDNAIKESFGNRPNSEFVFDASGTLVTRRSWSSPVDLRRDLAKMLGPVDPPTRPEDVRLNTASPPKAAASGVVPRTPRPSGARALIVEPKIVNDGQPFYVKLRAEAPADVLEDGFGKLYLGLHLDPLYHVHWNNLVDPIRVEIEPSEGVLVSEPKLTGPKVKAPTDIDPREFVIDVGEIGGASSLKLEVFYFACNDEEGWCKPVTQEYTVQFRSDPHGGRAMSGGRGGRGNRGAGGRRGNDPERLRRMFEQRDANGDGKLSRDEMPEQARRMFDRIDADGDGFVTPEEMSAARGGRGNRGGRGGRDGRGSRDGSDG